MKKISLFSLFYFFLNLNLIFAQNIEVLGKAQKKVMPDEIYLKIVLDEKQNSGISLDYLEKKLQRITKSNGLSLNKTESRIEKKIIGKIIYLSNTYELKLNSAIEMQNIVKSLKKENISNIYFIRADYSKKEELKKELYIKAIKNAKETAQILLNAIEGKLGKIIHISQINFFNYESYDTIPYNSSAYKFKVKAENQIDLNLKLKPLNFEAQIQTKFEIN